MNTNLGNLTLIRWKSGVKKTTSVFGQPWGCNLGNFQLIPWAPRGRPEPAVPPVPGHNSWTCNLGNLTLIKWQGNYPNPVSFGGLGITQTSGSIKAVDLTSAATGTARCYGAALGTIQAIASAVGTVHCAGGISGVEFSATAAGIVQTVGFATTPIPGSTLTCLEPPAPGPAPPPPVSGNRVY